MARGRYLGHRLRSIKLCWLLYFLVVDADVVGSVSFSLGAMFIQSMDEIFFFLPLNRRHLTSSFYLSLSVLHTHTHTHGASVCVCLKRKQTRRRWRLMEKKKINTLKPRVLGLE